MSFGPFPNDPGLVVPMAGGAAFNFAGPLLVAGDGNMYPELFDAVDNGNDGLTPGDAFTLISTGLIVQRQCFALFTLEGSFVTSDPASSCYIAVFPQPVIDFFGPAFPADSSHLNYAVCAAAGASLPAIVENTVATPLTLTFFNQIVGDSGWTPSFPVELTVMVSQNSGDADQECFAEINCLQLA